MVSILLGDEPDELVRHLGDRFPKAHLVGGDADYQALIARVVVDVEAPRIGLDLPRDVRCTAFEQRLWRALRHMPAGKSISGVDIAGRIASSRGERAIADA